MVKNSAKDTKEPASSASKTEVAKADSSKAQPKPEEVKEEIVHLIVFKLGAEFYAIKIDQVKEVTITPEVTRMPRTPVFVKGVTNIRGDIIALIDLEKRFGIRPSPISEMDTLHKDQSYTLVIEAKDYNIGVEVKEMPQSLKLGMSKLDKAPSFLQDSKVQENYIEGIAKIDNKLIIVLDMLRILTGDEIMQLPNK